MLGVWKSKILSFGKELNSLSTSVWLIHILEERKMFKKKRGKGLQVTDNLMI